jgi:hypothetical protein
MNFGISRWKYGGVNIIKSGRTSLYNLLCDTFIISSKVQSNQCPPSIEVLHETKNCAISKDWGMDLSVQNFDQLTINSLQQYNEISPVYVSTEKHLYIILVITISKPQNVTNTKSIQDMVCYRVCCCAWHVVLLLLTFVPSYFKIPWLMKKFYSAHKLYPRTDHVKLWYSSVSLILKVWVWLLHITNGPIVVNICAK